MITLMIAAAAATATPEDIRVRDTYYELARITGYCADQYTDWQVREYRAENLLAYIPNGRDILNRANQIYVRAGIEGRAFQISKHSCFMQNEPALENFKAAVHDYYIMKGQR